MYILGIGNEESKCRYHQALKMVFTGKWVALGLQGVLKRTQMVTKVEPYWSDSHMDDSLGNRNERE